MYNDAVANTGKELLLLFDGHALVHRAFHALPPLTQSKTGELVNAVYGFASTLLKVLSDFGPTHWAVAFDRPTPTFRHQMFEEYKAHRPPTPEELKGQIRRVHRLVEAFHIPVFEIDGFEADDVLGTLSSQAEQQGIDTIIVTGDNDMLQLVSPMVKALAPKRTFADTVLYDEDAVEKKYGIRPEQLPDLKALVGDVSDNIPGVPGVGAKTASRLLQEYRDLEGIYAHLDRLTPAKLQASLREHRDQVFRARELSRLVREVPIRLDLKACRVSNYDRDEVAALFKELEFTGLLHRLPQTNAGNVKNAPRSYHTINTETELDKLITDLSQSKNLTIGVELSNEKPSTAELVGLAVSPSEGEAFYVPLGHRGLNQLPQLPLHLVMAAVRPVLENDAIAKTAYNGKRIMAALANQGVGIENLRFDAMLAAYLLGEKNLGLGALAFNRLGLEVSSPSKSEGHARRPVTVPLEDIGEMTVRSCTHVDVLWKLQESLEGDLHDHGQWRLFTEVEMALIPVLAAMESQGILPDTELLNRMSLELGQDLTNIESEIYSSVGHRFNINSPQQLGNVLFQELKLPQSRRTKTGYSTDASVIESLKGTHPVVEFILRYRQLGKLKSTYVDALLALADPETGRVHTTFNQTGTSTGRLSSSDPNLQNIPVRGEMGTRIRKAIIAPPGEYLLSADYSQIDLRALAHLSRDPGLIDAFARDEDIHTLTASQVYGVPQYEVTPEMRRNAKTINFGIVYGMSDYGLEQATSFSREEASQFIARYFEKYPKIREYLEATKEHARKLGYVETVLGRRRLIPEINSQNRMIREAAERMAINAPVQGSSADIIKVAMIDLHREMEAMKLASKMVLQIHDELLFEVSETEVEEVRSLVARVMPEAVTLCVPLKTDIKLGRNWAEMR
ncbi:MAG: DNA polymerase I [Dehalococcoidia bacterium]